ncbi:RNA polymerase sigma factor [Dyadobacter sediminis]|uniref:RNA polymerase sigma factor n=1 Tax=Dyadobacter sediminis TaxID=1493691 RepID=UPI0014871E67|nr:RNA polymerase sigma-70 factor [Dyadobacter sediminis]
MNNLAKHTIPLLTLYNYSEMPEDELLSLLIEGNRPAFKQLYLDYYRKIFAYALKFTKSIELSEDITQEVFLKVWEKRENLRNIKYFKAYLYAICKNITLNVLTRAAREINIKSLILIGCEKFHEDTETTFQNEEYDTLLNKAIEQLPPQRKVIYTLVKTEGKSYEETAEQLGITAGTVNDHIVKATRSIKEYLLWYNITLTI